MSLTVYYPSLDDPARQVRLDRVLSRALAGREVQAELSAPSEPEQPPVAGEGPKSPATDSPEEPAPKESR